MQKRQMFTRSSMVALATTMLAGVGCGTQGSQDTASVESAALGDALPGTNAATFAAAKANFNAVETVSDGLGPIFNANACGTCHAEGAAGGAGQQIERRYGTLTNGVFDPLAATGGSLRQLFGLGGFNIGGLNCQSGADANPAPGATLFAGRLTTPLFGLGLVDSLPDSAFDTLASREPAAVRGLVSRSAIALPNPADPAQAVGVTRVNRFGWKANVPTLSQFAADAYLNEMGITTSSCNRGVANRSFGTENRANRAGTNAIINGCPDDGKPGTDDDFATENNNCAGGLNQLQDDVANFLFFMTHLAAPPRQTIVAGSAAARGQTLFNGASLNCSSCHRSDADIFVSTTAGGTPAGVVFAPFSDFLIHDMGTLGDQIGVNAGDSVTATRRMRTAPLWGLHSRNNLLHDGRTTDRTAAITAHNGGANGQGTPSAAAFNALSQTQKSDLLAFLDTL
jgi:CxxC motif-containing protein (DUF1111 family)